ncbi:unnamed protein product [Owenia fusiformis]|uniref:Uncharacterized protein n=1 Tax=Owenia fusiformis TaxID=6347 RepID=A0A8J1TQV9_OWEFU|nr:unnamed protein product [Owenia fusiformis]
MVDIALFQILNVHERSKVIEVATFMRFFWNDSRLQWNPKDYGNITIQHFANDEIWIPDITLYNSADYNKQTSLKFYSEGIPNIVEHTGYVRWNFPAVLRVSCTMFLKIFPFDTQKCNMIIAPWVSDVSEIYIYTKQRKGDMKHFQLNGEWNILDFYTYNTEMNYSSSPGTVVLPFSEVVSTIIIQRKPLYYIFNLIIPCIFLLLISTMGLLMPIASGSRAPLSIMVLLSMVVLNMSISAYIPVDSHNIPLISQFTMFIMFAMGMNVIFTVGSLNIHFNGHYGKRTAYVARALGKVFGIIIKKHSDMGTLGFDLTENKQDGCQSCQHMELTNKMYKEKHERNMKRIKTERQKSEWMLVAMVMDRCLVVCVLLVTCIVFTLLFNQITVHS